MSYQATFKNDPAIVEGDLKQRGGDYYRVCGIDNMVAILIGTDAGYWGNELEDDDGQIVGGLESLDNNPINSSFLDKYESKIKKLLQPIIDQSIATDLTVEATNPNSDRIDWTATMILADGSPYSFSGGTCINDDD